jgi:hypothetical protein
MLVLGLRSKVKGQKTKDNGFRYLDIQTFRHSDVQTFGKSVNPKIFTSQFTDHSSLIQRMLHGCI